MEFVDIDIADRSHWTKQATPPNPAIKDMSEIKAFARSSDLIRTYLPAVTKHAAGFSEFNVAGSMPEAVRTLEALIYQLDLSQRLDWTHFQTRVHLLLASSAIVHWRLSTSQVQFEKGDN